MNMLPLLYRVLTGLKNLLTMSQEMHIQVCYLFQIYDEREVTETTLKIYYYHDEPVHELGYH